MLINITIVIIICILLNYVGTKVINSIKCYNPDLVQMDVLDTKTLYEDLESCTEKSNN
jgi:hypothetical protein